MKKDYASAGVNVRKIRKVQDGINSLIKSTFPHLAGGEVLDITGHYAGIFKQAGETYAIHCDGVGSKVLVAQELGKYDTVGIDAVAMNVNDIACIGAQPLVCVDYLAVAREDEHVILEIMGGVVRGCIEAKCALVGGETAVMPDIIKGGSYPFDLAVTCLGRVPKDIITGSTVALSDEVIGLGSTGLHSNGYTLARRVLDFKSWGTEMLKPTAIYSACINELITSPSSNAIHRPRGFS